VLISYLPEEEKDALDTSAWITEAGRKAVLVPGDITDQDHCKAIVKRAVSEFGKARHPGQQRRVPAHLREDRGHHGGGVGPHVPHQHLRDVLPVPGRRAAHAAGLGDREHDVDPVEGPLAAAPGLRRHEGRVSNFTAGLAQMVADRGIRVNAVAPGPIWTPLIPSTMPAEKAASFGQQVPLSRAGQPKELAAAYVLLASDDGSYMSGAVIPVTGGKAML
jgi:NAD(P)-dependent dehydrogenase (short-subunit alcohol dehydrogenase family)